MKEVIRERWKNYRAGFEKIVAGLNPAQSQAVNTIEGPVLVVAGPGTGKTHILTARIGQILLQTDTQPHNILCLTFTDAGVQAMRERLVKFIGPEGHRVHIYTFHSFCNKIIQEHVEWFGKRDLEPLSELERIEVIRTILSHLPNENPLRRRHNDPYHYEQHLQDLFQRMKAESWSSRYISNCIDEYLEDLPNQDGYRYKRKTGQFKKGDLRISAIKKEEERMERLRYAAYLFEEYEQALRQRSRYDYEDMIRWVLDAFNQKDYLLRYYQEQYLYVLVDEYQDTNGAQNQIVEHLISYWEEDPNIFIVGDDDQSIYEFQGARVEHMRHFYERYRQNMELVVLKENYRSVQSILDNAHNLINFNDIRIIRKLPDVQIDKDLHATRKENNLQGLQIYAYPDQLQEEVGIVQEIQRLQKEGVQLKEIAIIYALHRQGRNIIRLLEKLKIPYQTKRRINILEMPWVRNFIRLLHYISDEYQQAYGAEADFYELLHFEFLEIVPADIATISAFMAKDMQEKANQQRYDEILRWRDIIKDEQLLHRIELQEPEKVLRFSRFLDDIWAKYPNVSLPELIERAINRSGLLTYIAHHADKAWYTQVIYTLFDFAISETYKNPILNLDGFLDILKRMRDNRIILGVHKTNAAEEGVQLMTAHSSKGLEFEHVFILNALKEYWEPGKERRGRRFPMPSTLTFSGETDSMEAARRLFYVAMTRAKDSLHISYYNKNNKRKRVERTQYLDELLQNDALDVQEVHISPTVLQEMQWILLREQKERENPVWLDEPTTTELLRDFKMSVSSMNTYLHCPTSFYFEYVLRLPSIPSAEAQYGIAAHYGLKRLFDASERHNDQPFPALDILIQGFMQEMERQRVFLPRKLWKDIVQMGKNQLETYYRQRIRAWENQRSTENEKAFRNIDYKGVPLVGTIDKIVFKTGRKGKVVQIVDYKTGQLDEKRLAPPSDRQPQGGNYWRQLVFYKILMDESRRYPYPLESAHIDYLTPNKEGTFDEKGIKITSRDVAFMQKLIKDTYRKIQHQEFQKGCGSPSCKWCQLIERHYPAAEHFNNEQAEMMDDV